VPSRNDTMNERNTRIIHALLSQINIRRTGAVFTALFFVEAVFLLYVERLRLREATGEIYELITVSYLLHLTLAIFLATMVVVFYVFEKKIKVPYGLYRRLPLLSVFVVLIISAVISIFDQMTTGHVMMFGGKLLIFGFLLYIRPPFNFLLFGVPYLLFVTGVTAFQTDAEIARTHGIYSLAIFTGVLFASVSFYRLKVGDLDHRLNLKQLNKKLKTLSTIDPLTELPNRRYFEKQIHYEMAINRRYQHVSTLLIVDIDHFKAINDTYGHHAGDTVLQELGALLKENVRESDTVARWGGEEFMLLLSHTDLKGAEILGSRLLKTIADNVFMKGDRDIAITASMGITLLENTGEEGFKKSYQTADKALYESKKNGRNRLTIRTP